jgi:hypothetical protein
MIINLAKRNVELSAVTGLLPHHPLEKKGFSVTKHPFWGYIAIFGNHMGIGCHQEPRSQIGYGSSHWIPQSLEGACPKKPSRMCGSIGLEKITHIHV